MDICDIKFGLEVISGLTAFAAAAFWFYASSIGRKSILKIAVEELDKIAFNQMRELDKITVKQARFNSLAAGCAGIAALLLIVVIGFMPICRAFQ